MPYNGETRFAPEVRSCTQSFPMRFQHKDAPPPYLNRKDQLRMLILVATLAAIVFAIQFASRPATWHWLLPPEPAPEGAHPPLGDVDFNVRDEEDPLRPDAFRAEFDPPRDEAVEVTDAAPDAIDSNLLADVRDNTVGVRHAEADAYYRLLASARRSSAESLERAAQSGVVFTHLMVHPELYRGELVTLVGDIKRLQPLSAGPNEYGIKTVYEAWLFTSDSGVNPYRIVATSVPPDVPLGERIEVPARVTGYFFKKEGYATPGGMHVAPLLLAKRIDWIRPPVSTEDPDTGLVPYVLGIVGIIGLALIVTLWRFSASDRKFERSRLKRLMDTPHDSVEELNGVETVDVDEVLRRLSDTPADANGEDTHVSAAEERSDEGLRGV